MGIDEANRRAREIRLNKSVIYKRACGDCCKTQLRNILREDDPEVAAIFGLPNTDPNSGREEWEIYCATKAKLLAECDNKCPFLGVKGCILPREGRPKACTSFLCHKQKERQ
ncbi:MAG: hypothetical protein ACXABY_33320 [Candidatus Thorarchaeota archaeon]|jgi:hypothetical protein